ncbi:unnamed protein product, partial [Prorocentrum cordatum]
RSLGSCWWPACCSTRLAAPSWTASSGHPRPLLPPLAFGRAPRGGRRWGPRGSAGPPRPAAQALAAAPPLQPRVRPRRGGARRAAARRERRGAARG